MTQEENELLTRTGPKTPCGNLMRCYWHPVALSEELLSAGGPLPVRLLSEDLVLFRDDQGRPGLLELHCSHRGADLSYGRLEDGGLRCIYHGWLYDIYGNCVDQPGEPGGGKDRNSIRHPAYPCKERGGVIFAFLGEGTPPEFPNYEFLSVPDDQIFAVKLFHECNYLQANEGNVDLLHLSFLHYNLRNLGIGDSKPETMKYPTSAREGLAGRGAAPEAEAGDVELTSLGVRSYKIRNDMGLNQYHLYLTEFVVPNFTAFPGLGHELGGYSINWHVPIDDTHHWKYTFIFSRHKSLDKKLLEGGRAEMTRDYHPKRNRANRYLQDRESMKVETYAGVGMNFQIQDLCVVEGIGAIQDRIHEHLGSMDRAIVATRKVLLKAIQVVQQGEDPPGVVRGRVSDRPRIIAARDLVPTNKHWRDYAKELEGRVLPAEARMDRSNG